MMGQHIVTIERHDELAKEYLSKIQFFIYQNKAKVVMELLCKLWKRQATTYKNEGTKRILIYKSEDKEFLQRDYDQLEKEFDMDYKELEKKMGHNPAHDRNMALLMRKLKRWKDKIKIKSIKSLVGESSVRGWLAQQGISINHELDISP